MDINALLSKIRQELEKNVDRKTRDTAQRFFKEEIKVYGIKTAVIGKIARKYLPEVKKLEKDKLFSLCEKLLQSDYLEEASMAFDWSYSINKQYEKKDLLVFEKWLKKYVNNWAKCDVLCNHTIGAYIEMFPEDIKVLKLWAKSDKRWVRRAAAVTLIVPARHGKFLKDIFEIADILLMDKDDLVQKGYGWMLKAASQAHQKEVFDYVMKHKKTMPRTALRYAIEKMPPALKKQAMER